MRQHVTDRIVPGVGQAERLHRLQQGEAAAHGLHGLGIASDKKDAPRLRHVRSP